MPPTCFLLNSKLLNFPTSFAARCGHKITFLSMRRKWKSCIGHSKRFLRKQNQLEVTHTQTHPHTLLLFFFFALSRKLQQHPTCWSDLDNGRPALRWWDRRYEPEFQVIPCHNTRPSPLTSRIFYVREINFTQSIVLHFLLWSLSLTLFRRQCLKFKIFVWNGN